jgi:SAM-dependent methyltransferase
MSADGAEGSRLDAINLPAWVEVADEYAVEGWSDPGELGALTYIADRVRGVPILDIGIGGGRTVSLLRLLSGDYLGIDYMTEFVELARKRHPGVQFEVGDARDLRDIADHSKGFVAFSLNGIDAIDHDERQRVLASVRRVLRPGGTFWLCTLNKDNPMFGANPGNAPDREWLEGSLRPAPPEPEPVVDADADTPPDDAWLTAVKNWRRLRKETRDEGDWGLAPFAAHQFGFLAHFSTVKGAVAELDSHGFDVDAVFDCNHSTRLAVGDPVEGMWMHLVATKRA